MKVPKLKSCLSLAVAIGMVLSGSLSNAATVAAFDGEAVFSSGEEMPGEDYGFSSGTEGTVVSQEVPVETQATQQPEASEPENDVVFGNEDAEESFGDGVFSEDAGAEEEVPAEEETIADEKAPAEEETSADAEIVAEDSEDLSLIVSEELQEEVPENPEQADDQAEELLNAGSDFQIEGKILKKYTGTGGNIVIPSGITVIDEYAFVDCIGLQTVVIPSSVTKIGYKAFSGCRGLRTVSFNLGLTEIDSFAFYGCSAIKKITIPNTVVRIGKSAFDRCSALSSVTLSNKLLTLEEYAFTFTALTSITVPGTVTTMGKCVFENCSALQSVVLGGKFGTIKEYCFAECKNLTSVQLGSGIEKIEYKAFSGCSLLKTINIPDTVISIQTYAFSDCTSLKSIVIPDSVQEISNLAFCGCSGLTSVTFGSGLTRIGNDAFTGTSIENLYIPANVSSIGSEAFDSCKNMVSANIQGSSDIPSYCFWNCEKLSKVTIGKGAVVIHDRAFINCVSLSQITIPNSVTDIQSGVFLNCSALESVYIPESVTHIGYNAFASCTNLKKIVIPESVTVLDGDIFDNSPSVTIYGVKGSFAEDYANEYGIPFVNANPVQPLTASMYKNQGASVVSGMPVRIWVEAAGGTGTYQYKFLVSDSNGNWFKIKEYGSEAAVTWYPSSAGNKTLYADIKDDSGNTIRKSMSITVTAKLSGKLTASVGSKVQTGQKVTLSASASGGTGGYQYKFLICDANGNWYKIRDYASGKTASWTPGALGAKTLYADIKDSSGKVVRVSLGMTVTAKLSGSLWTENTVVNSGSSVNLYAAGTGGTGGYQYKFLVCDVNGNWYKIRDFAQSSQAVWKPSITGKKYIYVDIKDTAGNVVRKSLTVTVSSALSATLTSNKGNYGTVGSAVTLTAYGNGGTGSYSYKFLVKDSSDNWYKLQDYSAKNTTVWTPTKTGQKTIYVDVRDSSGKVVRKSLSFSVSKSSNLEVTYLRTNAYPGTVGSPISISAGASGGSGTRYFKFLVQDVKTGNWFKIQDFSTKSTASWTPSQPGEKKLYVDVKDSTGKTVRHGIGFNVTY